MHLSQTTYTPTPSWEGKEVEVNQWNVTEKFSLLPALAQGPEKQHQFQEKTFVAVVAWNWSTYFANGSWRGGKWNQKTKKITHKKPTRYLRFLILFYANRDILFRTFALIGQSHPFPATIFPNISNELQNPRVKD